MLISNKSLRSKIYGTCLPYIHSYTHLLMMIRFVK